MLKYDIVKEKAVVSPSGKNRIMFTNNFANNYISEQYTATLSKEKNEQSLIIVRSYVVSRMHKGT